MSLKKKEKTNKIEGDLVKKGYYESISAKKSGSRRGSIINGEIKIERIKETG